MKKFFKITGIVIAVIIALMIILPYAFKGKIVEIVKTEINENVNAKVDFDSFHLSFFRSFPDVNLRLKNLSVINNEPFEGDTLAHIRTLSVRVSLFSFFGGDGYKIKSILLDHPNVYVKILEDGSANWDIEKERELEDGEEDVDTEGSAFKLTLKRFALRNANILYDDKDFDIFFKMTNSNLNLSGDFTESTTNIIIQKTNAEKMFLNVEGIPLLAGAKFDMEAGIAADLDNFSFTFLDNRFEFNNLVLNFSGSIDMPESDVIMDVAFETPQNSFKSFLSLVPAIYAKDFSELETDGTLAFDGFAKGVMDSENIPEFVIHIIVDNGMFKYPDLPAAVTDVNINSKISNPGGIPDLTVIDISTFNLKFADNPVDIKLNLKTPISDPQIDAVFNGKIDLSNIKNIYPLAEGESLAGMIQSDIKAKGRMSAIEEERYNDFLFDGSFVISDMKYTTEDFPEGFNLSVMNLNFSPQFVELSSFKAFIGQSDISATGRINNLLGFVLNDEMLTGRFNTQSKFINLNQFVAEDETPATEEKPGEAEDIAEPVEMSVFEVPANINFTLKSNFDKLIFDNIEMTKVNGTVKISDQSVMLNDLKMNLLDGEMTMNGMYSSKDIENPKIDFDLDIKSFDIQKSFNTFNTFASLAPIGKYSHGKFSSNLKIRSLLDEKMSPVLNSMSGSGKFASNNVRIENSNSLLKIAEQLKMDRFKNLAVNDVLVFFEFNDGLLEVKPFDIKFGKSTAEVSGYHSFDQTINYAVNFSIPRSEFGGAAEEALNSLVSKASAAGLNITPASTVNVGAMISGTVSEPKVSISLAQSAEDFKDQAEQQIKDEIENMKGQAEEAIEDVKEEAREELEKRAQQVIKEAEKQAEKIRNEAAIAAQKIRNEARDRAEQLENEATGPIEKAAAKRAGKEIVEAADKKADDLEKEADAKAERLITEANQKADRIRKGVD
ncbi:MAG: AsmA-like C-terminal region-containing protein [Bacteroidales bacterium]